MRPERLFLLDIVGAADNTVVHIGARGQDAFLGDVTTRAAVLHELTVIGEAAARLPAEFRSRYPDVPWAKIVAFRNLVVHAYFGLDWAIVWETATELVPVLGKQVSAILAADFPEAGGPD